MGLVDLLVVGGAVGGSLDVGVRVFERGGWGGDLLVC